MTPDVGSPDSFCQVGYLVARWFHINGKGRMVLPGKWCDNVVLARILRPEGQRSSFFEYRGIFEYRGGSIEYRD